MTDKQIYRRLNEAYHRFYGFCSDDEWFGTDSPLEWQFYRPKDHFTVYMKLDVDKKVVNIWETSWGFDKFKGSYSW